MPAVADRVEAQPVRPGRLARERGIGQHDCVGSKGLHAVAQLPPGSAELVAAEPNPLLVERVVDGGLLAVARQPNVGESRQPEALSRLRVPRRQPAAELREAPVAVARLRVGAVVSTSSRE